MENIANTQSQQIPRKNRRQIEKAFAELSRAIRKSDREAEDDAVFNALELDTRDKEKVYNALEELREMRKLRAQPEILIEHPETKSKLREKKIGQIKIKEKEQSLDRWFIKN